MTKNKTAILILAAGASQRMGKIKQLLPWKNTTLLGNAIAQAKGIKSIAIFVVLGANACEIKEEIDFTDIQILENLNWKNGLGSSLAISVSEIDKLYVNYNTLLVILADQPLIDTKYLENLLVLFNTSGKKIAATQYKNGVGVPAIFSDHYFEALKKLNVDFGAKALLKKYIEDVASNSPKGKEKDVDTWEDYQNLIKTFRS